jgi:ATP-binding cassette subfamily B protein
VKASHWWRHIVQRYPFYEQQSATDCGAACLVMVGRYWGKRFSINRIRDTANIDRSGASVRGLAAAAESMGFSARPIKADYKALSKQPLPAIAHWGGNHYIVVYKITADRVIVADPALGQRSLKRAEFNADWTGYALLLQPTPFLTEASEAETNIWRFFELIKPHGLVLFEVLMASILIQIFGLLTPLLTQLLLDRVVVQRSELTLMTIGLGLLIFGLFKVAMTGLRQYLLYHTANRVDLALIVGFINHAFRLPLRFFESRYVGDIISRVQENHKIQRFFAGQSLSIALDLLTTFVYLALMFWYSWKLGLLVLAIIPPFVILALVATPFLQRISRRIFNASAVESSYLIESFTGIRTIKSMAIERSVRWHWEELFNKSLKMMFSGQVINTLLLTFSSTIEAVATAVLLWFGAWLVIHNQLTIGQLVAFNMLLTNVIRPFQRLIELWNQLQEVVISIERIDDVIEAEPEEDLEHQSRQVLPPLRGHIRFEQVTFRYHAENDTNTLENITFEAQPGQTIALVGRSGSGKTTVSKLVLGLYPPTEGKILIDGYDITCVSMQSLRRQIGVVDQNTFLFGGTIRENISISHPTAKLEDVIEAARQAGADQFIKELPMGYETQIGEAGGMLSGGQRQRLAIARALLGNPRLLIFDEATSSLDSESERIIQNNMGRISQDRTTIIIAHRLSTIRHADTILVLDRGVLVEQGNHDELMKKRGHYFYLNQQQLTTVG